MWILDLGFGIVDYRAWGLGFERLDLAFANLRIGILVWALGVEVFEDVGRILSPMGRSLRVSEASEGSWRFKMAPAINR